MKIGLILECQRGGPDQQIYEHLLGELYPSATVETYPQNNKLLLMENAATDCAMALSVDKCDFVFVIWDLSPAHPDRNAKLCMKTEKDLLLNELATKRINLDNVKLICIEYELESFLVADGRGLTKYKQEIARPHPVEDFVDCKKKAQQKNPKEVIWKYVSKAKYNDTVHALKILKYLNGDYSRIRRRNACFERFMSTVELLASQ